MSVVEAERLRSNANLTGMKGKRSIGGGGHVVYQLEDPCAVFEKIPGTPKYWQRVRYEIIAKLENLGPFQIFFTLTSGDLRRTYERYFLGSTFYTRYSVDLMRYITLYLRYFERKICENSNTCLKYTLNHF